MPRKVFGREQFGMLDDRRGDIVRIVETRNTYRILMGKLSIERPRRWKDNIKMHLREMGYESGRSVELAQGRVR
jgi:hypothetical protein